MAERSTTEVRASGQIGTDTLPEPVSVMNIRFAARAVRHEISQQTYFRCARSRSRVGITTMALASGSAASRMSSDRDTRAPFVPTQPDHPVPLPKWSKPVRPSTGTAAIMARSSCWAMAVGFSIWRASMIMPTEPILRGSSPGLIWPERRRRVVSPFTSSVASTPSHRATRWYQTPVFAGSRERTLGSHLLCFTKKVKCPPSGCESTRSRYSPSLKTMGR